MEEEAEEQRPPLTRALLHRSATTNTSQVAMVGSNQCPIESLDYEIIENDLFDQNWRTRSKVDKVRYVVLKWTFCFAIGILTGIVGFVINLAVENVSGFKHDAVSALMESASYWTAFWLFAGCNMVFLLFASSITAFVSPAAGGSGIPEVKAYLNGVDAPNIFSMRTLAVKRKKAAAMARLYRDSSRSSDPAAATTAPPLPSPLPDLGVALSDADLRATAYELLVAASRVTAAKPLTYIPQSAAAATKTKGAFGLGSSPSSSGGTAAVLELVRARMGVTEQADARIRRALLRVAAGQLGRPAESMVWPLEFLQKCKASDFLDPLEYEAWQTRNFKLLEAGLLVHPLVPLKKSSISAKRMRQIIHEAYDGKLETGRNSESMIRLRSAVMSLACRSLDETSDECHWADGFPLNLHIYKMLVEACFDVEEGSIVQEIDETMELLKKTWPIFGVNQMLHNLYFTWALFNHFVMLGQANNDLLCATENLLVEIAKDAKITKDPDYSDVLGSTLNSIMGWTEKRLLVYHETFNTGNIYSLQYIVSIGISSAKILVENQDMSYEYHSGVKGDIDVMRSRIETYIHSSLRSAFAQC
ncbi:hypothetical protein PVAP13_6NG212900 [Panicum virgatum]|uniref:Uncharacterized protein n=1 Tax=Panicum virgatum TaxID=38727 RepID=A0A8T0QZY7_PANVG|nr:hypothetical protein PVAP13_6NG212900 [Panicum virgatum]